MNGIINKTANNNIQGLKVLFDQTFSTPLLTLCGISIVPDDYSVIVLECMPTTNIMQFSYSGTQNGTVLGTYGVFTHITESSEHYSLFNSQPYLFDITPNMTSSSSLSFDIKKYSCVFFNDTLTQLNAENANKTSLSNHKYNINFANIGVGFYTVQKTVPTYALNSLKITNDFSMRIRVLGL